MARPSPAVLLRVLFLVSGAPGLMAQLAWVRVFSAMLGHELPALVGVVSAFFGGLAAGAWCLDRAVSRSAVPGRWYAGLEAFSGAWIAAGIVFLPGLDGLAGAWNGLGSPAWIRLLMAFLVPLAVAGPAAAAMGATLPAMDRAVGRAVPGRGVVAGLYALNTAGAVLGVGVAVAWVMPAWGFRATLALAATLQAACALGAWILVGRRPPAGGRGSDDSGMAGIGPGSGRPAGAGESGLPGALEGRIGWGLAAGTGMFGMGYELVGVRGLAQATENTIHTYAAILAVFLGGTALGAAGLRWVAARRGGEPRLGTMLAALALMVLAEGVVLSASPGLMAAMRRGGWPGLASEGVLAMAVFLGPTLLMGAVFARLAQAMRARDGGVGRVSALNSVGGMVAGPVLLGLVLPASGLRGALGVVAAGYLGLAWWASGGIRGPGGVRGRWGWLAGFGVLACALGFGPFPVLELPPGAVVTWAREGFMASVAVVRTGDGHRTLRVNNHFQQGGTATAAAARRHAHLPLLLHPEPRRVLFLGVGTGLTMGAAGAHPGLAADGVELLPEVVAALGEFEPENGGIRSRAGFRVIGADARRYARVATETYDVVMADLFHPSEDGAGFLYTREHFEAVRGRLAPGGVVCQWLPLHQLDVPGFRDVARTFLEVFPDASLWLLRFNVDVPVVGLVAGGLSGDPEALQRRLAEPGLGEALRPLALADAVRVLGCRLADPASLRRLAAAGSVATDDLPTVLFRGAAAAYDRGARPHARLMAVLEASEPGFAGLLPEALPGRAAWLGRLEAFRRGRDRHLRGLALEVDGARREAAEAYVASAAESPDYTGGYAQAVLVASAYAASEPAFARGLLERLVGARPEQRLAREMLERMGPAR